MTDKKWKLVKSKPVFQSKWLSVLEKDYELPDGKKAEGYYHLLRPDYVLIIAVNKDSQIVVERSYRRGVDDFVYELPAGWIEKGETPKMAAERELLEETGITGEAKVIGDIYAQPGFSSMRAYVALVRINTTKKDKQRLADDEDIAYEFIEVGKVKEMIDKGEIKDMGSLAALQLVEKRVGKGW